MNSHIVSGNEIRVKTKPRAEVLYSETNHQYGLGRGQLTWNDKNAWCYMMAKLEVNWQRKVGNCSYTGYIKALKGKYWIKMRQLDLLIWKEKKPLGDRRTSQLYKRVKVRNNLAMTTAIKRNKVLIHAVPWVRKLCDLQEAGHKSPHRCMISFIGNVLNG